MKRGADRERANRKTFFKNLYRLIFISHFRHLSLCWKENNIPAAGEKKPHLALINMYLIFLHKDEFSYDSPDFQNIYQNLL